MHLDVLGPLYSFETCHNVVESSIFSTQVIIIVLASREVWRVFGRPNYICKCFCCDVSRVVFVEMFYPLLLPPGRSFWRSLLVWPTVAESGPRMRILLFGIEITPGFIFSTGVSALGYVRLGPALLDFIGLDSVERTLEKATNLTAQFLNRSKG